MSNEMIWYKPQIGGVGNKLSKSLKRVAVQFSKRDKTGVTIPRFSISQELLNQLKWQKGDKIIFGYNGSTSLILKRVSGDSPGYSIRETVKGAVMHQLDSNTELCGVFSQIWNGTKMDVEYFLDVSNNQLIINIPTDEQVRKKGECFLKDNK